MLASRRLAPLLAALTFAVTAAPAAAAGDWLQPSDLLEPGATLTLDPPLVAMDAGGDATVVWLEEDDCANGSCTEIQVKTRQVRADGSRTPTRTLTPPNAAADSPDDAELPQVAVDGAGIARVAWLRPDDDFDTRVEMVTLDAAGTPGNVIRVSPPDVSAGSLGLGMNDAGRGAVAWSVDGGVEARAFAPSGAITNTATLHPTTADHFQREPAIAVDQAGIATVAWNDLEIVSGVGTSTTVEARRLGPTGPPGTLHTLDSWADATTEPLAIDVHPSSGRVTILWSHFPGTGFEPDSVKGARITASDALAPFPAPVSGDEPAHPDVAVAADGTAVAAYDMRVQPGAITKNVVAQRIAPNGSVGGLLFVSDNGFDARDPEIDVAPDGTAFVGWFHESFPRSVRAARIPAGAAPEDPEPLTGTVSTAITPAVAADRDGSALAAFVAGDGGDHIARAIHFDGEGPTISAFGFPGRGFVGQQLWFGADFADDLNPLVGSTWSFGDGGTGSGQVSSHTFTRPGTFPVTLRTQDTIGNETSRSGSIVISAAPTAPAPGGGGQRADPPSFTVGTLRARLGRRTLIRRGLTVGLSAPEPTAFAVELLGRLRGAKLAVAGDLVLAEQRLPAAAGPRTARLKVTRTLRSLVRRGARLRVRITATGADGGTATATRRVRVTK